MTGHQGWIASLSNGETVFESGMTLQKPKGELTAWQRLLQRLKADNLRITQLRLQRGSVTIVAMPNAEGYMQAYESRISAKTLKSRSVQGIGTIVGNLVYITWINNQGHVWQDVRPLEDVWVHTDRRQLAELL